MKLKIWFALVHYFSACCYGFMMVTVVSNPHCVLTGVIKLPILEGSNVGKCMVILRDLMIFPQNGIVRG